MKRIFALLVFPLMVFGQLPEPPALRSEVTPAPAPVAFGRDMGADEGSTVIGDGVTAEAAGVAIGASAGAARRGVAIGQWAFSFVQGVAIGYDAFAGTNAIAIGAGAVARERTIQLGKGTNEVDMLRVGNVTLLDRNGFVPLATMDPLVSSSLDSLTNQVEALATNAAKGALRLSDKTLRNEAQTNSWLELETDVLYHVAVTDEGATTTRVPVMTFSNNVVSLVVNTVVCSNLTATGVSKLILPTSTTGLTSGMLWNDGGVVRVVP